jgi:predicted dehydrogenase
MIMIGGSKKMLVWDDLLNTEKIKIYESGVHLEESREKVYQALVRYRTGDMYAPKLDGAEALKVECAHFVDCIENKLEPLTNGHFGMVIVAMLEAAQKSLNEQGKIIPLDIL